MENESQSPSKNDVLSQSYCEGIKKIVGTTVSSVLSFQVPDKLIQDRKHYWYTFFGKHSDQISDELPVNINTLESEPHSVHENDPEEDVEEYLLQRIPIRKSLNLIQHWVDTGYILHDDRPDNHKSRVTRPTVNKQALLKQSVSRRKVRKTHRRYWRANSRSLSSSSVDTAAYILSNANRTKKAEATAIVEGAKLQKNMGAQETKVAEECPPLRSDEGSGHISNEDLQATPVKTIADSQVGQDATDPILKSRHPIASLADSNMLHNTILTPDSPGPENNNVQFPNQNIMLRETIEKALKCLTNNSVITPSQSDHDSIETSSHDERSSTVESQTLLIDSSKIRRKKLYSGRDSPVDLITIRSSMVNRLSQPSEVLHPALDPVTSAVKSSYLKKRKLLAIKRRQKWTSLFAKTMNGTGQMEESGDKSLLSQNSEELNNTMAKDIRNVRARPARKTISQKVRCTPKRTPIRRKLPDASLKQSARRLKRMPTKVLRKHNLHSSLSNSTMNPIVSLTKLSDSYIKKYTSRNRVGPPQRNVASTDESVETDENQQNSMNNSVGKKSTKSMLPPDTQYIDSDDTGSSRSTILFVNCLQNGKSKRSITNDTSSATDGSSQELLYKVDNAISIANGLEKVNRKHRSPAKSNDSFHRLMQKSKPNLKNVRTNSPRKAKRLGRSGNFEIIKHVKDQEPVVLLQRLPSDVSHVYDDSLDETLSRETSKKTRETAPVKMNNSIRKEGRNVQSQSQNKPTKTKKPSDRFVFRTTLGHANWSDSSDYSGLSTPSNGSRILRNNTEASNNKRNRVPLITITSDEEDDLENLIQHLPRKRAKPRTANAQLQNASLDLSVIRLAHTMEIVSDATDDIDTVKKSKRKGLQSKANKSQKSEVRIADSTTHDEDGKTSRRSKRIEQITPKKVKNGVRKSRRLIQNETKMHDREDTIRSTDGFTSTEPDVNHITSTSRVERVSSAESETQLSVRTRDKSRETLVNKKTQVVESPTRRKNTNKYSANVECSRTKARSLQFQTRLFDESSSECFSPPSCPLSAA